VNLYVFDRHAAFAQPFFYNRRARRVVAAQFMNLAALVRRFRTESFTDSA
jgi:hypothetical protein